MSIRIYCRTLRLFILFFSLYGGFVLAQQADSVQTIPDTLLFRIQRAQAVATEVNATNKKGFNLNRIKEELAEVVGSVTPLKQNFSRSGNQIDTRNLINYELILKDAGEHLESLRQTLIKHSNLLQNLSQQVIELSTDSILQLSKTANAEKQLYFHQLQEMKVRLDAAGKITGSNLQQVNGLLADVSAVELIVNDLKTQLSERLRQSGKMAMGLEVPYLWRAPYTVDFPLFAAQLKASYDSHREILMYFVQSTWDKRTFVMLVALCFFFWVHRNFNLAKRPAVKKKVGELTFDYLKPFPVLASVIVFLNCIPLFEQSAPSLYIELTTLFLLLAITIHLRKVLKTAQLKGWLMLVVLYALTILWSGINGIEIIWRLPLLVLNLIFVCIGIRMFSRLRLPQFAKKYVRSVVLILIGFNGIAFILNLFGRLSLAKAMALTGVIGVVQLIGLAVFIQLLLNALELQIKISSCSKGLFSRVDHARTRASVKKILQFVALVLWVLVFMVNMNLTNGIFSLFQAILEKERSLGSLHFSLGNILFFILVIYLANKLQKNVPLFFGERNLNYEGQVEQKSSKVALIRLIIILLGILIALTASGLPMDRVTVVLGALGVGIGLGMQNIVNNFVSGIILIFERPFRIGDFVELADKKGRVKDIGIRSSKLLTQQGSEVIIPNGDLLSGRLVNWTLSHDYVKTELLFKVPVETDLEMLKKMITDQIAQTEHAMPQLSPEVLVNMITAGNMEIKILAWVESIYSEPAFKSNLMAGLLVRMNKAGVKVT